MIYDTLLDLFKLIFGTIEFFKPFAVPLGILVLLLKQNNIKKVINGKLPKRFRDTQSSDIYDMMRDIKSIKEHLGVVESSNTQQNGRKTIPILSYKRFFLFLQMVFNRRRTSMLTNLLRSNISKKLLALLIGAAVAALNKKLNLDLTPEEVVTFLIVIGGYILGQSHVDAKKVLVGIKDSPLLQMGFTEAIPILQGIHDDINNLVKDVRKNDGSQAFKDAMQAYAQIKPILDALKHPDPVAVIVEDKVAS